MITDEDMNAVDGSGTGREEGGLSMYRYEVIIHRSLEVGIVCSGVVILRLFCDTFSPVHYIYI